MLAELVAVIDVVRDLHLSPSGDSATERGHSCREAKLPKRARLEVFAERAEVLGGVTRKGEPAGQELGGTGRIALANCLERGIDHLCDRSQVLDWTVVDQLGQPPAFLLLRQDALGEQSAFGVLGQSTPAS